MHYQLIASRLASGELIPDALPVAGGGDYCSAWDAGDGWLVLVARTDEASRSLERAASILPVIAPRVSIPIPEAGTTGVILGGQRFLMLRRLPGVPLSAALLDSMSPAQVETTTRAIAAFLGEVHATPADLAMAAGIPIGWYPFAATEDAMRDGPAEQHYVADLAALTRASLLDRELLGRLDRLVTIHLQRGEEDPILLHGEVSADHVLIDPETLDITGIIDFQGVILGDPVRDLIYLSDSYGSSFVDAVLSHYSDSALRDPKPALEFYRVWHEVARLLWAAEHGYQERVPVLRSRVAAAVDAICR